MLITVEQSDTTNTGTVQGSVMKRRNSVLCRPSFMESILNEYVDYAVCIVYPPLIWASCLLCALKPVCYFATVKFCELTFVTFINMFTNPRILYLIQ